MTARRTLRILTATWGAALLVCSAFPHGQPRGRGALVDPPSTPPATTKSTNAPDTSREDSTLGWRPPHPRSAGERADERERMVRHQIESPGWMREAVSDRAVLRAMRDVPRHAFVPRDLQKDAYDDTPLPIGHGQTISQPYIVAVMTERLRLDSGSKVLEIGTGSGYQAAVLAELTPHVYTVEIIEPLAKAAEAALAREGYNDVHVRAGDGYFGWPEAAPFDAIVVTCAAGHLPPPLWDQIKPGGRIVIPIGGTFSVQRLVVIEKTEEGKRRSESVMDVRFVPLTGRGAEG